MIETVKNVVRIIIRGASYLIRVVLSVAFGIVTLVLSIVWKIIPQDFRLRINNAVTLICWKLNQAKRTMESVVGKAFRITTFPFCLCFVPLYHLTLFVVPTALMKYLHGLFTAVWKTALCQWLHSAYENRSPVFIRNGAGEAFAIMLYNVDLSRQLYHTIWNWICSVFRYFWPNQNPLLPDRTPRGLQNLGNTCYFNSVMQSLCNTHVFSSELRNTNRNEKLTLSFCNLAEEMKIKGRQAFAPSEVRYDFVKNVSRFDNRGQHDSHECLRHFLDEIRKEQRKTIGGSSGSVSLTAVDKIFGGHLVTVYICKECDKHYHLFEPCLDISLPVFFESETKPVAREAHTSSKETLIEINNDEENNRGKIESINQDEKRHVGSKVHKSDDLGNDYKRSVEKLTKRLKQSNLSLSTKTPISLDDCLKHFSRVEQINEEYLCEDCLREAMDRREADEDNLKLTSATKQTLIFNPPAILTIHFKRFELLPGRSKKRSDMVKYPEYLDIAPYCSSQCLRYDPPRNNIWYSLYAVVVHSGSLEFGHYVAYVKVREGEGEENARNLRQFLQHEYFNHNVTSDELILMMNTVRQETNKGSKQPEREADSRWYLMNDSSVYEVDVEEVLEQEAYLLFYERVDSTDKQLHWPSDTAV